MLAIAANSARGAARFAAEAIGTARAAGCSGRTSYARPPSCFSACSERPRHHPRYPDGGDGAAGRPLARVTAGSAGSRRSARPARSGAPA